AFFGVLPTAGISAARFDFSSSNAGTGRAEVLEVVAETEGPQFLIGYSFGADIATTVEDPRIAGWVLVAPPLRMVGRGDMVVAGDLRPKLVLPAEHDQFSPPEHVRAATADWVAATVGDRGR